MEVIATANNQNLRPFNTLPPEERREISRKGGIASGERRREIAEIKETAKLYMAAHALIDETREEYRAAIKRYVKDERRKERRRRDRGVSKQRKKDNKTSTKLQRNTAPMGQRFHGGTADPGQASG